MSKTAYGIYGKTKPRGWHSHIGTAHGTGWAHRNALSAMVEGYLDVVVVSDPVFSQGDMSRVKHSARNIRRVYKAVSDECDVQKWLDTVEADEDWRSLFYEKVAEKRASQNPRMSMREFIRSNRDELDAGIRRALGDPDYRLNDKEREQWILNDEGLYWWARRSGVRI